MLSLYNVHLPDTCNTCETRKQRNKEITVKKSLVYNFERLFHWFHQRLKKTHLFINIIIIIVKGFHANTNYEIAKSCAITDIWIINDGDKISLIFYCKLSSVSLFRIIEHCLDCVRLQMYNAWDPWIISILLTITLYPPAAPDWHEAATCLHYHKWCYSVEFSKLHADGSSISFVDLCESKPPGIRKRRKCNRKCKREREREWDI